MRALSEVKFNKTQEEIVDIMCKKTGNNDRKFFRIIVTYFLAKMATSMRATIVTADRGNLPTNLYNLSLASSGSGKGFSVNLMEDYLMSEFRERFMDETFPAVAEKHVAEEAIRRAVFNATDEAEEIEKLEKEFHDCGALVFDFDSGTPPALKQQRHKMLLAKAGSLNFQVDEIGSNLIGSTDLLNAYLELYDKGKIKQKLIKNTSDSKRVKEIVGMTPTNMLLFGTHSRLLDGGPTEDSFYAFLETGYARRCFFAYGLLARAHEDMSAEQIYDALADPQLEQFIAKYSAKFGNLADLSKYDLKIKVGRAVGIELIRYKIECEKLADSLPEHEEIKRAEITHRYFKALKLAGVYAFIDDVTEVTMEHLYEAIKLAEESGEAFSRVLQRERPYIKLARYLAAVGTEQTHADLHEALPFYKSAVGARNEMMTLATAWGYKQHIIIKKTFVDGIEFFTGEALKKTDTNEMIVSYSPKMAHDYVTELAPWEELDTLFTMENMNWSNHTFRRGHRSDENTIPGFNMITLDIDDGIGIKTVMDLLSDYKFLIYTTKRHTDEEHRFRLVMPINYHVKLDGPDYKEFIRGVVSWLPFQVNPDSKDNSHEQRSKKWASHPGLVFKNDGILMDALTFIPKTQKNENYIQSMSEIQSMDNLERWFAQRIHEGERNVQLHNFARALVDTGLPYREVEARLLNFNRQLSNGLSEDELRSTILITVSKQYQ